VGGWATLSWTQGQTTPSAAPAGTPAPPQASRDLSKWPLWPKQFYLSGQRGNEWLQRANGPDGRFIAGYVPALRVPLEAESYIRQVGAAIALAKAAKYFNDDKAAAKASQALLTLLLDTAPEDPSNPAIRIVTLPGGMTNRLGAAAALVQAIHELPQPGADLLDQADQLCNAIRRAQRTDGSLCCTDPGPDGKFAADDNETVNLYSGEALYALMRSQQHRPAAWKLDLVKNAVPYYQARWRSNKTLTLIPRHTAANAEAYLQTGDKAFADFVFEMNDWLCTFQYHQLDPQHPLWVGGFMSCVDGKPVKTPPHAISAAYAECLGDAARVARKAGDLQRWERYKGALERSLQFLLTLQYTDANCQHFNPEFRPFVVGAFHASNQDGNIRLDYTQQAVCAMVSYLTHVADIP